LRKLLSDFSEQPRPVLRGAGARRVDTNQIAPDRRIDRDFGRRRRPYNVSQLLSLEGGYQAMRNIRVNDEVFNRAKAAGY